MKVPDDESSTYGTFVPWNESSRVRSSMNHLGDMGQIPLKAEAFLVFGRSVEATNCPFFYNLETRIN